MKPLAKMQSIRDTLCKSKSFTVSTTGAARNSNVPRVSSIFTFKEQQPLRWAANAIAWLLKLGSKQQACVAIAKSNTMLTYSEWELLCELPRTARTRVKHFGTEGGRQKSLARAQLVRHTLAQMGRGQKRQHYSI